jgi:hypothetical protein
MAIPQLTQPTPGKPSLGSLLVRKRATTMLQHGSDLPKLVGAAGYDPAPSDRSVQGLRGTLPADSRRSLWILLAKQI